jgi:hypothetical protein
MEIEKNEDVEAEENVEKNRVIGGGLDASVEVAEEGVSNEESAEETEEVDVEKALEETEIEKAAVSDVEVEEPDFVKMLDDLKTFFGDNLTKSAEETRTTVEELSKTIDARITELADKHDSLSKAVENIKSAIDTIEKRVDLVENETAVKKSRDLEGSKEEKTIRKGIWSGSFLGVRDL